MNNCPNKIKIFRQAKGWSLQQLAEAIGTSKSQIDKLERGERRLSVDWMVRLAKPLGCDPRELMAMKALSTFLQPPTPELPIFTLVSGPKGYTLSPEAFDTTPCPPHLLHTPQAYALFVPDNQYAPLFRAGQLLYLSPLKPIRQNHPLLLQMKNKTIELGLFHSETGGEFVLQIFTTLPKEKRFSRDEIQEKQAIVSSLEPR